MARNPMTPFRSGGGLLGGGDPFLSLHREMNRLFDDAFRSGGLTSAGGQGTGNIISANMNVSETDKEIRITAELPGVSEKDIEVTLDDDVLTIRGEKKLERKDEKENFHFVECSYGTFQRALRLPFPVDPDQIKASFENGVLTVALPKTAPQDRSRRIEVRANRGGQGGGQKGAQTAGGFGGSGGGDRPSGSPAGTAPGGTGT